MLTEDKVNIKVKLAAHWACLMSLYIYADYFELKTPGKLDEVMRLKTPVGDTTPELLVVFSLILIIPSLMILLSVLLKPKFNKWLNILVASIWSVMSLMVIVGELGDFGGWYTFYVIYQFIEVMVFFSIIWHALKWPKEN